VTPWLRDCARLAFDRPFVRETLLQYANLINRLSGESIMSEEQKKEIVWVKIWIEDKERQEKQSLMRL
jgi:hypothetical protein